MLTGRDGMVSDFFYFRNVTWSIDFALGIKHMNFTVF